MGRWILSSPSRSPPIKTDSVDGCCIIRSSRSRSVLTVRLSTGTSHARAHTHTAHAHIKQHALRGHARGERRTAGDMNSTDASRARATDDDGTPLASPSSSRPRVAPATAGWFDLERALRVVYAAVMDEVKPLGVVGMASFDPLAGFALWREQRAHERDRRRAVRELYPHMRPEVPSEDDLSRVRVAVKHAIGAYGTASAALGDASLREKLTSLANASDIGGASSNDRAMAHAKATEACAKSAGIAPTDIIDADWTGTEFSPSAFVAVDAAEGVVVLSIRGTWEAHDALTDVSSSSVPFLGGWAHAGMVASAWQVLKRMAPALATSLAKHPTFTLLVTGHSMGGGVAACVAMLLHSDDDDVKLAAAISLRRESAIDVAEQDEVLRRMAACACVCIAAPSVSSMDLSEAASAYITCVVAGADVVPRLCHASVRRLLRRLNAAAPSHAMLKAFSSVLGGRDRPAVADVDSLRGSDSDHEGNDDDGDGVRETDMNSTSNAASTVGESSTPMTSPSKDGDTKRRREDAKRNKCQGAWGELEDVVGLELRDHAATDFMVQPGRVIHFKHLRSSAPTAELKHPTAFTDVTLDPYMMLDHIPGTYQAAVKTIHDRVQAGGQAWVKHADSEDDEDPEHEEQEAMSAFVRGERVRARAERGWKSLQTFLGIPNATNNHDGDGATTIDSNRHSDDQSIIHARHRAAMRIPSTCDTDEDDEDVPDYYGERAELRVAHAVARAAAAKSDDVSVDGDSNTQSSVSSLAAAWAKRPSWLGGRPP